MKRVLALVTVLSFLIPSTALARPADESTNTPRPAPNLKAQGMAAAAEQARLSAAERPKAETVAARPSPSPAGQNAQKKSFWKTPWPYVIVGAVVIVGVIAAKGGYGNGEGPGY